MVHLVIRVISFSSFFEAIRRSLVCLFFLHVPVRFPLVVAVGDDTGCGLTCESSTATLRPSSHPIRVRWLPIPFARTLPILSSARCLVLCEGAHMGIFIGACIRFAPSQHSLRIFPGQAVRTQACCLSFYLSGERGRPGTDGSFHPIFPRVGWGRLWGGFVGARGFLPWTRLEVDRDPDDGAPRPHQAKTKDGRGAEGGGRRGLTVRERTCRTSWGSARRAAWKWSSAEDRTSGRSR